MINQSIEENLKPTVFIIIVLLLLAISAYPQYRMGGKVVEILDGKTVAIELFSGGKLTAELQHIEVPEAGQQFHQTAVEHLQKLVLAKNVEFRPLRIINARTIGQVLLNGVDVSQQMIRDGAAWYSNAAQTGQNTAESTIYQSNEAQAKTEKRGIWSIEGLKPAWQIRAETEENRRIEAKRAIQTPVKSAFVEEMQRKQKPFARKELNSESQVLSATTGAVGNLPANFKFVGGLLVGYDPAKKSGMVLTPLYKTNVNNSNIKQEIALQIIYIYYDGNEESGRRSMFVIGIDSVSDEYKFLKSNDLIVTADGEKIIIGKAKWSTRQNGNSKIESMAYEVKKTTLAKIAKAQNVSVKVGNFSKALNGEIITTLSNLLQVAQ